MSRNDPTLLTIEQVAAALQVSKALVRQLIAHDGLRTLTLDCVVYVPYDWLIDWIKQHEEVNGQPAWQATKGRRAHQLSP